MDSSQAKSKSPQEELVSGPTQLSLGTPGTRRAVYYTEEHESGSNHDSSNSGSPLHRSPSIGPKFGRLADRSSIQLNSPNRTIRNTTSEYTISTAVGSPLLPPRNSLNNGSRNWNNKNRDLHTSLIELSRVSSPTSSITSKDSNLSQVPLINSVKNSLHGSDQSDCELSNFTNSGSRNGSVIGRSSNSDPLDNHNNSESGSSPIHRVNIPQNRSSSLHENSSASIESNSPSLSLRSNSNRNNSPSVVRTSSLLLANNSAKPNHQLINNSLPKLNNEKGGTVNNDLPSQPSDTGGGTPRTVDNSIWYEYGCV